MLHIFAQNSSGTTNLRLVHQTIGDTKILIIRPHLYCSYDINIFIERI